MNVNHRLAPEYQFPAAEQDVAAAVAWTYRHVAEYGGDPERLLVAGHSSGGHLTALVATDSSYLEKHDLAAAQVIKGIVSLSGVMDVEDFYHHSWFMRTQAVAALLRKRYGEVLEGFAGALSVGGYPARVLGPRQAAR